MTLDDVAREAGVTKSFVSAVERGDTSPSIGSLYRICEVLGVPVASLFETAPAPESNVVRRADVRGVSFGGEGVENLVLSPRAERRAQVIETHVAPGGSPGPEPWSHSGDLIIATVLEGTLEFRFEDHATVLDAGDTISYSPVRPPLLGQPQRGSPRRRALLRDAGGVLRRAATAPKEPHLLRVRGRPEGKLSTR